MAIVPKFSQEDIKRKLLKDRALIEKSIIQRLKDVGEQFIIDARTVNTYKDRTGNLRSSIGFVILKDGVQLLDAFSQSEVGTDKVTGVDEGLRVAGQAADKFPTGIVLIVVAGMEYAAAVESKGNDVLTGSSFAAIKELKATMQRLSDKLK